MLSLSMNGPYPFHAPSVDKHVTKKSPGNYALGRIDPASKKFTVKYVGRRDTDVNSRIKSWVGNKPECGMFKFSYAAELLDNDIHPARPDDAYWQCPHCYAFHEAVDSDQR